jgi:hypothetical protein
VRAFSFSEQAEGRRPEEESERYLKQLETSSRLRHELENVQHKQEACEKELDITQYNLQIEHLKLKVS